MADALKKLFSRMSHTSEELKLLQDAVESGNEKLAQAQKTQSRSRRLLKSEDDPKKPESRQNRKSTNSEPPTVVKRPAYYQDLINEPLLSDSPSPKPAPRDAKILPFQDPLPREILPYSEHRQETLPRNVTPDPVRTLPGVLPSRHNPDISDMRKVYPNIYLNRRDENKSGNIDLGNPGEERKVLGTPFTMSEARNLLRLGWIALEFLRDDRRPCCIVEVSKSNVTLTDPTGSSAVALNLRKTDLNTGITTMVDASDPVTISQLMGSVETQIEEDSDSMPQTLPHIMFENEAFLNVKKRLEPDLGRALASALQEEPPRTVTQGNSVGMSNSSDRQQGRWMKQDEAAVDKRKVQREFVDHEGKMWRITSIDVTPDIGKDPLSPAQDGTGKQNANRAEVSEGEDGSGNGEWGGKRRKGRSASTTKGWKVFYVESVFPAPVGVDWPTSSITSIGGSISRTTTFPSTETRETRSSGNNTSATFSRSSTFQETAPDGKRSFTRTITHNVRTDSRTGQEFRRMSIPEEPDITGMPAEIQLPAILGKANATLPSIQTDGTLSEDLLPQHGLGARVKLPRTPINGDIELSAFVGLGGSPLHLEDYYRILEADSSRDNVSREGIMEEITAMPAFWTTVFPPGRVGGAHVRVQNYDRPSTESGRPVLDWTRGDIDSTDTELAEHYNLLRSIPWEQTGFGPLSSWSRPLRLYSNTIMSFPHATTIYWGPQFLQLYNVAWKAIVQERHPAQLGLPFEQGWPELISIILPLIKQCYEEGISTKKVDEPLFIDRQVPKEECYFHFHIGPLIGEKETPEGVIEQAFERTNAVIAERRLCTTKAVMEASEGVRDLDQEQFWQKIIDVLANNPRDFPFALLYIHQSEEQCYLEASLGIPDRFVGQAVAPLQVNFSDNMTGSESSRYGRFSGENSGETTSEVSDTPSRIIQWDVPAKTSSTESFLFANEMYQANETGSLVYKDLQGLLGEDQRKLHGIEYRGYGDPCYGAVVLPIQPTSTRTHGYLIVGLNPRRPYDSAYQNLHRGLIDHLSTTVARVKLMTEDFKNAVDAELALVERRKAAELRDRLTEAMEQLKDSELMFTKFAERIPIGTIILNAQGHFLFVNDAWYDITAYPRQARLEQWISLVYEEDREGVRKTVQEAFRSQKRCSCEFRVGLNDDPQLKRPWKRWVIKTIDPDQRNGKVKGFFATLVDVTSIKMAELYQKELTQQAIENERRQENFIDITSHELRNPLSAILQSAESIVQDMQLFQKSKDALDSNSVLESARTILLCVNHQTRIIEDILTVSKLDALLLTVTPTEVQIHDLLARSLTIFDDEVRRKNIALHFQIKESYIQSKTNWVFADPSRVTQVLVNLITNAIKFTALVSRERKIHVCLEASATEPISSDQMPFLPMEAAEVQNDDNGWGVKQEWQDRLFQRFKQAPKTHITYGGSGLGLFICKKLCHAQGGNIGFTSEEGKGSTFTFFIKVRQAETPVHSPARQASWPTNVQVAAKKLSDGESNNPEESFNETGRSSEADAEAHQAHVLLVVEDNLINQRVLQQQLTREGYTTLVANDGQEAFNLIMSSTFSNAAPQGAQHISAVLMDMEMPIMDGTTATRLIRQVETEGKATKHIPIIGISANARPEQLAIMTDAGMDLTIAKPFRIGDLVNRINMALSLNEVDTTGGN